MLSDHFTDSLPRPLTEKERQDAKNVRRWGTLLYFERLFIGLSKSYCRDKRIEIERLLPWEDSAALPFGRAAEPHPVFKMLTEACCWTCDKARRKGLDMMQQINRFGYLGGMIVCPTCGNKRCPKASWHKNQCSGSNEPGQEGSIYQ